MLPSTRHPTQSPFGRLGGGQGVPASLPVLASSVMPVSLAELPASSERAVSPPQPSAATSQVQTSVLTARHPSHAPCQRRLCAPRREVPAPPKHLPGRLEIGPPA